MSIPTSVESPVRADTLNERPNRVVQRKDVMLSTIAIMLVVLWLLGVVSSYTMGSFIHVLLVVAIVMFLVDVIQRRK